jgi:hypothetical protein
VKRERKEYHRQWARKAYQKNPKRREYQKEWKRLNPVAHTLHRFRARLKAYGVTLEWFIAQSKRQKHRCFVCRKKESVCGAGGRGIPRRLSIDHSHKTNKVRKLLCSKCNLILGLVDENPKILRLLAKYLIQFK